MNQESDFRYSAHLFSDTLFLDTKKGGGFFMMNYAGGYGMGGFGILGFATWALVIAFLVLGSAYFWKGLNTKK